MVTGSCLCGGVAYEADGSVVLMARCHCVQCRKASGAEFATNASVLLATFRITRGRELLKRFESSAGKFRVFCGHCGSPLFKEDASRPDQVRLRLGTVDSGIDERPLCHVFVSEKPAWSDITDGTPEYATRPGA